MIKWLRKLFHIVRYYDEHQNAIDRQINLLSREQKELVSVIKERTTINVDVGYRGRSDVILIGHYKGRDFVQGYRIRHEDFSSLVNQLKEMQKYGVINRIDEMHSFQSIKDDMS